MDLAPQIVIQLDGLQHLGSVKAWQVHKHQAYSLTKVVAEGRDIKGEMPGRDESIAEVGSGNGNWTQRTPAEIVRCAALLQG